MEYRRLGNAGAKVSVLGVGCNQFGDKVDEKTAINIVHAALDAGINFFDTSDRYGRGLSEEFLGKALKGKFGEVIVATKFGAGKSKFTNIPTGPNDYGGSRYHIMNAIEESLQRLQTDHIDLFQMHSPDSTTPIEETLRTLDDLVRAGKVRYIGCSNFRPHQLVQAMEVSKKLNLNCFVTAQEQYNLLERGIEGELVPYYQSYTLGLIPYFPLASGLLTGKYKRGQGIPPGSRFDGDQERMKTGLGGDFLSDFNFDVIEKLEKVAKERNHNLAELAIAWLLAHNWVSTVIAGAVKPEQVTANVKGTEWKLTQEEMRVLENIEHHDRYRKLGP